LDILQRILLDVFDLKLFNVLALGMMYLWKIPTAVAREYIERGEHDSGRWIVGSLSRVQVRRGVKDILFV